MYESVVGVRQYAIIYHEKVNVTINLRHLIFGPRYVFSMIVIAKILLEE